MTRVDVVVVSYNSADHLRACVAPLARLADVEVIVVDNASRDDSLATVADLPLTTIARETNDGFATGCNAGWRAGSAPFVLFLNPDATIDERSLRRLVAVLERDEAVGAVAPRIEHPDGSLVHSLRRFPRLRATYARALFLHRLLPHAAWTDEIVREDEAYRVSADAEWVSGACVLVRRSALLRIGGFDEQFFLYCEDKDLCRRLASAGFRVRFDPAATAIHVEGASAPRAGLHAVLAGSRVAYAQKHAGRGTAFMERVGLALGAILRAAVAGGGGRARLSHLGAFATTLRRRPNRSARP